MNEYKAVEDKLCRLKQTAFLSSFQRLNDMDKKKVAIQIMDLQEKDFSLQIKALDLCPKKKGSVISPPVNYMVACPEYETIGKNILKEGKVGTIIVAGGQSSRLLLGTMPKGKCEVSVVKSKTLFQLFAENTKAAGLWAKQNIPLAFMTSLSNHEESIAYFRANHFFGLNPEDVDFFQQQNLPFLNEQKQIFLQDTQTLAQGPNGNGDALYSFYHSSLWKKFQERGVEIITFLLIDNPLADPFDFQLLGMSHSFNADVVIKAIKREDPLEKVGVIVEEQGQIAVREYSELDENTRNLMDEKGNLDYSLANISLFAFSMPFIKKIATDEKCFLPLHPVKKEVISEDPQNSPAWKFEKFIFDLLPFSDKTKILLCDREDTFAPLKNLTGPCNLLSVKSALQAQDKKRFKQITSLDPNLEHFELDRQFYYPTEALKKKWYKKQLDNNLYIEP